VLSSNIQLTIDDSDLSTGIPNERPLIFWDVNLNKLSDPLYYPTNSYLYFDLVANELKINTLQVSSPNYMVVVDPVDDKILRLAPVNSGSSGSSGSSGTSAGNGEYFQIRLDNDISASANTVVDVVFDTVDYDPGSNTTGSGTVIIQPDEVWELETQVTTYDNSRYTSIAFYNITDGTYIKTYVHDTQAIDNCPSSFNLSILYKNTDVSAKTIGVRIFGTNAYTIIGDTSPGVCNSAMVDGGVSNKTWFYGHRIA
jgi:hypothetical protein